VAVAEHWTDDPVQFVVERGCIVSFNERQRPTPTPAVLPQVHQPLKI
jgi:hypothetical protein